MDGWMDVAAKWFLTWCFGHRHAGGCVVLLVEIMCSNVTSAGFCSYSKAPAVVEMMGRLKQVFDPNHILNPYKYLPSHVLNRQPVGGKVSMITTKTAIVDAG